MFASWDHIQRRCGKYGTPRGDHLQQLVTDFQECSDLESKIRIVANLGNFSYDPLNYQFLRPLNVVELFLDVLCESASLLLVRHAVAALCNLSCDPASQRTIIQSDGVPLLCALLASPDEEALMAALATLHFLCSPSILVDKELSRKYFVPFSTLPDVVPLLRRLASPPPAASLNAPSVATGFLHPAIPPHAPEATGTTAPSRNATPCSSVSHLATILLEDLAKHNALPR
eukprot:gnl/Spiro4/15068_TR8121_c0_g1_i1.p1 gnl/Spiro4/15068_TR8121_c0_g1~~gnl/Spiro4/15068_TR8121_c0_g1_i1.p1  ORF type:complete len:230 (+),score=35.39 gnl/Spiro4/15068_TR8121_c0_g1_i1:68-757(+)